MSAPQPPKDPADYVIQKLEELRTWLDIPSPSRDFAPFWSEDWRPKPKESQSPLPSEWGGQENLADDLRAIFNQPGPTSARGADTTGAASGVQAESTPETPKQPYGPLSWLLSRRTSHQSPEAGR
jgi:hypothetical protein